MLSQEKEGLPVSFENKLNYVRMLTIFGNARVSRRIFLSSGLVAPSPPQNAGGLHSELASVLFSVRDGRGMRNGSPAVDFDDLYRQMRSEGNLCYSVPSMIIFYAFV